MVPLEGAQPRDDTVGADVVVPAVRPHESENLVAVGAREQRHAVAMPSDPEVLGMLNGGSACQVIAHAVVNLGRNTPARSSRRHLPASTCSVSSRTIASPRNRAGSSWCANGTRSTPR